jgi:phospholipid-binding lipoprotein MlaA
VSLFVLLSCGLGATSLARAGDPEAANPIPDPLYDDPEAVAEPAGFPDPLEPLNRATFRFNGHVSRWVLDPLIRAYDFVVPAAGRHAIRRALVNLDSPAVFANDVLQIEPVDAGVTATRFALNTTIGLLGLFDPATRFGIPGHESDFGQTLALLGTPSGPYLMLPVIGPTTARDGTGYFVDFLFRPTTYLLTPYAQAFIMPVTEGGAGIATLDANVDAVHALEASSVDYYAALKNAYYQDRIARIWARRDGPHPIVVAARWALGALPFTASRAEVGHLAEHDADQPLEAVSLER